jgi:hypothetical protein
MASVAAIVGIMPGGVGTFEAATVGVLTLTGTHVTSALAATLLLRGFTFWLRWLRASCSCVWHVDGAAGDTRAGQREVDLRPSCATCYSGVRHAGRGGRARLKAAVLKTARAVRLSGVRISPPPLASSVECNKLFRRVATGGHRAVCITRARLGRFSRTPRATTPEPAHRGYRPPQAWRVSPAERCASHGCLSIISRLVPQYAAWMFTSAPALRLSVMSMPDGAGHARDGGQLCYSGFP